MIGDHQRASVSPFAWRAVAILFTAFALSSCGQKGPLYLPEGSSPDDTGQARVHVMSAVTYLTGEAPR